MRGAFAPGHRARRVTALLVSADGSAQIPAYILVATWGSRGKTPLTDAQPIDPSDIVWELTDRTPR